MSNCKSYVYPGTGKWLSDNLSYAQAIRVENRIHCSGQGGWDPSVQGDVDVDSVFPADLNEEIDRAFANVDLCLKQAGGQGWSQVYAVTTYSTDLPAQAERLSYNLRKWMPHHKAVWTELGVKELGAPKMRVEVKVEAYDPEGAAKARAAPEA